MANAFTDSFSGHASVVDLSAHTGETGHGWVVHPGFSGGAMRVSPPGEVTCPAFSDAAYIINQDLPAGDLDFKVSILYNTSGAFKDGGIIFRASATAKTCYLIHTNLNDTYLTRYLAGAETVLAVGSFARTNNTYYTLSVRVRGTKITVLMNGTQIIDFDDTSTAGANLPKPGRFGLYGPAGNKFDDLQIDTASAAATSADGQAAGSSSAAATGVTIRTGALLSINAASVAGSGENVVSTTGTAGGLTAGGFAGNAIVASVAGSDGSSDAEALTKVGYTGYGDAQGTSSASAVAILFETITVVAAAQGTSSDLYRTKSFSLGAATSRGASDAFAISRDVPLGETFGRSWDNGAVVVGVASSLVTSVGQSHGTSEAADTHAKGFLTGVGTAQGFSFATTDPPEPVVYPAVGAATGHATSKIAALSNVQIVQGLASGSSSAAAPRRAIVGVVGSSAGSTTSSIVVAVITQSAAEAFSTSVISAVSGSFVHKPTPEAQTLTVSAVVRSITLPATGPRIISLPARPRSIALEPKARIITL